MMLFSSGYLPVIHSVNDIDISDLPIYFLVRSCLSSQLLCLRACQIFPPPL